MRKTPDADKLSITKVNTGADEITADCLRSSKCFGRTEGFCSNNRH